MESVSTAVAGASSGEHGWEQSWEHGQAIVNGVRLHYVAAGAGPVVLLLHGFPECWYTWRRQIPALAAAGFRVVAPDMRGYNTSEKPPGVGGYMIEALVGDALGLIQCFGDGRATVVGHDWGGYIAWHVAMAHPEAVAGLAVLNGPHPAVFWREVRRPAQALRSWYQVFFQLPWLPEAILCAGEYALLKRPFRRDPIRPGAYTEAAIQRNVAAMAQPGALSAALNYYRAGWRHGWRQTLREMRVVE
ncbi:MAG: alpha/beta fold hydrolase, partial [Chloroflexota bacterium]